MKLALIFCIRDRDAMRLQRALDSLQAQTDQDFTVIMVDYGSSESNAKQYKNICARYPFCQYVFTATQGWPFNRSHALNTGIRISTADYIITTDVDIIFRDNFVATARKHAANNIMLHCRSVWLPKHQQEWPQILQTPLQACVTGNGDALGICIGAPKAAFEHLRGFDEALEFYGGEDRDLHKRLLAYGLQEKWLDSETSLFHQWHPITRGGMPQNYYEEFLEPYLATHAQEMVRNTNGWGKIVTIAQRPLLQLDAEGKRFILSMSLSQRLPQNFTAQLQQQHPDTVTLIIDGPQHKRLGQHLAPLWQKLIRAAEIFLPKNFFLRRWITNICTGLMARSICHDSVMVWQAKNRHLFADRYLFAPFANGACVFRLQPGFTSQHPGKP